MKNSRTTFNYYFSFPKKLTERICMHKTSREFSFFLTFVLFCSCLWFQISLLSISRHSVWEISKCTNGTLKFAVMGARVALPECRNWRRYTSDTNNNDVNFDTKTIAQTHWNPKIIQPTMKVKKFRFVPSQNKFVTWEWNVGIDVFVVVGAAIAQLIDELTQYTIKSINNPAWGSGHNTEMSNSSKCDRIALDLANFSHTMQFTQVPSWFI